MIKVPFASNSYQARSLPLAAQRCVNLYAEAAPQDALSTVVLYGTPGLIQAGTIGDGPIRLLYEMAGILYAVSRDQLYSVNASGVGTLIGTLNGQERTDYAIQGADNGTQLVLVNTGTGAASVYDADTATLSDISDADFPRASSCSYVDGYHLFTRPSTGQWFISDLLEATSYDALDFATAETYPDQLVRVFTDHREVWLFGDQSIEIWTNTGAAAFPFQRLGGTVIEKGCAAGGSVSKQDNSVYWLGSDRVVYRAAGYQPQRISTHAMEYAIEGYDVISDAQAFCYATEGHQFYCITFPAAGHTWVFDAASGLWHERESFDGEGRSLGRWRVNAYARAYGLHVVGDYASNKIYVMDLDYGTEAGIAIRRHAVSPVLQATGSRVTMARLELTAETGVGETTGQGSAPEVMLDWSDDGGRSWSNEHWSSLGAIGAYRRRCRWYRLGQFRERYLRIHISDPVKVALISASAELAKGLP
jgi:hypothetical protein